MAEIIVTVTGLKELEAKLARFPNGLRDAKRRAMSGVVLHVQRKIMVYPPQQPTPYIRTTRLMHSWTTRVSSDGNEGFVGSALVPPEGYAPFVQGSREKRPGQSRVMQRKGWQNIDDVAEAEEKTAQEIFEREITRAVKEFN